jgi:undecaprenyl-diphosphatase
MVVLFLFAQTLCPCEDDIMHTTATTLYARPVYRVMQGISYAGHPVLSGAAPLLFFRAGEYDTARHAYLGLFINCASVIPLKYAVNRQRPIGEHKRWESSFPSSHTTFIFTQAYIVSHHYPKTTIPVFAFAGAVGLSRIYLQKHYPTDIVAGVVLGLITGFVVTSIVD